MVTEHLTEYVDLFPTLVDAAELPPLEVCPEDSTKTALCREGMSLVPLLKDPNAKWKERVFSQYPREGKYMGYTMRTDKYRYTEWVGFSGPPNYKPDWSNVQGIELYDHQADPEENHNVAHHHENVQITQDLSKMLHDGWRAALPQQNMQEAAEAENVVQVEIEEDMVIIQEIEEQNGKLRDETFVEEKKTYFKDAMNSKFDIL